jgi:hypothetical protein
MADEIKIAFIERALRQYNAAVEKDMKAAAARLKVGATGEGIKSIDTIVSMKGAGGAAMIRFKEYLRMVDMGAGRKHPIGGLKQTVVSLKAQEKKGLAFAKDNTRKPKKIYSKTAYGNLTYLQNKLLYGLTEEAVQSLKKELSQNA